MEAMAPDVDEWERGYLYPGFIKMGIVGVAVLMAMGVEEYREVRHDCQ